MFNVGGGEIVVLLLLALLLLGPERLPDAARKVGRVVAEIRRVTSGFEEEVRSAMDLEAPDAEPSFLDRTGSGPQLSGPMGHDGAGTTDSPDRVRGAFVADLSEDGHEGRRSIP